MSNHDGSYMLRDVLRLMLDKEFFNGKTDEERQDFMRKMMSICDRYDGNVYEAVEGIESRLRYCHMCKKVVQVIHEEDSICSKCKLEELQEDLRHYERLYGSLDYFEGKGELEYIEERDKGRWIKTIEDIEKYKKLFKEEFSQ